MKTNFGEDCRVKFPTLMHLMSMGYKYVSQKGLHTKNIDFPKTNFDPATNILTDIFTETYYRLNPEMPQGSAETKIQQILSKLKNNDLGRQFYKEILLDTKERIIDLSNETNFKKNNVFHVATEVTCGKTDGDNFRPDITLFVNGLPLAFLEVKIQNNKEGIDAERNRMRIRFQTEAFRPYLNLTQIMVFSNDMDYDDGLKQGAFYATIGKYDTKYNCFREEGQDSFPIKKYSVIVTPQEEEILLRDNNVVEYKNAQAYQTNCKLNTPTKKMCDSLFSYERFYFLLKYGIAYVDETNGLQKHIMRYPQIFATKAIEAYLSTGEQKGIIWHTQGSGKTALVYFNIKYLTDFYSRQGVIPQFYFIVDRLELLNQAEKEFKKRGLYVNSIQDKEDFARFISSGITTHNTEGKAEITVVNIHKFSDDSKAISQNAYNLKVKRIYFIDEAHRNYNPEGSFLKNLFTSDKNAIKIALTGTPIISNEYKSTDIFGQYIHTYFYNASIADGYTLRLIREDIGSNFKIKMQEALKSIRVQKNTLKDSIVYAHENYVQPLLDYIIEDLRKFRADNNDNSIGGLAVCDSKEQAEMMYRLFLEKYTDETELNNYTAEDGTLVYKSISASEIETKKNNPKKGCYRAALITFNSCDNNKDERAQWVQLFKDGKVDILIVFQMLQTGFDSPRLKKLYLHRMVKEHNLLQTLTRVNRPYKDMRFGYLVDFANIEEEYQKTNSEYKEELENEIGKDNYGDLDRLFVDIEEAKQKIKSANEILGNYEIHNPQIFSRQIDLIDDRTSISKILASLEDLRCLQNMLISQGTGTTGYVDIQDIHHLIKATRDRLYLLSYEEHSENFEQTREILNTALENIDFSFYKKGQEELEIREQLKQAILHTRQQLNECADPEDPEYRTLLEEFFNLFNKKKIENIDSFNMHEQVKNVNSILRRIKQMNEMDAIRAIKYNGDTKFVRVEKRLNEKLKEERINNEKPLNYGWTEEKQKLTNVLLLIKENVDDAYFHNQAILENQPCFKSNIKTYVTRGFTQENIESNTSVRSYVSDIICGEYYKNVMIYENNRN